MLFKRLDEHTSNGERVELACRPLITTMLIVTGEAVEEEMPSGDIKATESDLSSGGVIGITAGLTLLVALPVGVVLGCWGRIWWTKPAQDGCSSPSSCWKKKRRSREQTVIYEEPDVVGTTAIPLSDNEAYAINTHQ